MRVLQLTNVTSLTEVAKLLAACPNLTELYLDGKDVYWNPSNLPDTLLAQNLKVLQMKGSFFDEILDEDNRVEDSEGLAKFLERLELPQLSAMRVIDVKGDGLTAIWNSIRREGVRGELLCLELDLSQQTEKSKVSYEALDSVLASMPSLTNLTICDYLDANMLSETHNPAGHPVPEFFDTLSQRAEDGQFRVLPALQQVTLHVTTQTQARSVLDKILLSRSATSSALTHLTVANRSLDLKSAGPSAFDTDKWARRGIEV